MNAAGAIDIDHLRQWIGRTDTAEDHLSGSAVARWHAALDEPNPAAGDAIMPRLAHWMLFTPDARQADLGRDGHPRLGGFLPPIPLPRRMWAGGELTFRHELPACRPLRRTTTIEDIVLKDGRQGRLLFVTLRHRIGEGDQPGIEERQDLVYRTPASAPPDTLRTAGERYGGAGFDHEDEVCPDEALLFRYSALTFNAHRIHYDQPYARYEEGYPDLVVQGPLTATLLMRRAARWLGRAPMRFAFRGVSPLFVNEPVRLCARETAGGLDLWALAPGGRIAMTAAAQR